MNAGLLLEVERGQESLLRLRAEIRRILAWSRGTSLEHQARAALEESTHTKDSLARLRELAVKET